MQCVTIQSSPLTTQTCSTDKKHKGDDALYHIVHIDDVLGAFLCAVDRLLEGFVSGHEIYAVSSGSPITLKQLVSEYEKVLESKINILWGKRPYRDREVMIPWNTGSILPNWEPSITLSEGLKTI